MNIQWYPGHMTKARRMMQEDIKLIDIVIELVDSRIPFSSKNPDIDELAKNKYRLILLNKSDLADDAVTTKWENYYKNKDFAVAKINARDGMGMKSINNIVQEACKEKIERDRKRGIINRPIRAMIVGIPNVGKSTLLASVSRARPKIADYHFTTLSPNLGVVYVAEGGSFVLADIPGLVEGASEGVGLGYHFLRHVERTRLLLHVVDAAGSEGRDPVEDFHIIQNELEQYGEPVGRPQLVVLNKCDLMPEKEKQQELVAKFKELGYEAFPVSAATRQGFDKLLDRVVQLLPELPPPRVFMEEEEEEEPSITDMSFTVTQQKGGVFVVEGPAIQRLIDSVNFEDEESMNWFHRQLRDRGIIDELRKKGAKEGSPVQLGDMEFDFIE